MVLKTFTNVVRPSSVIKTYTTVQNKLNAANKFKNTPGNCFVANTHAERPAIGKMPKKSRHSFWHTDLGPAEVHGVGAGSGARSPHKLALKSVVPAVVPSLSMTVLTVAPGWAPLLHWYVPCTLR